MTLRVIRRVIRIVETKGPSAIPAQSWQTIRSLTERLGIAHTIPALGSTSISLAGDLPSASINIERILGEDDPRVRNAFMFGNFISLSTLAPSTTQRNEALARAEVFARETGLSGNFLRNLFEQLGNILYDPQSAAKVATTLEAVCDELQQLR